MLKDDADLIASLRVFMTTLIAYPVPDELPDPAEIFEPGLTFGAFADGELVGTAQSFSSSLVLPGGGRVRQAAVTDVGVLATHTRQGLASALLQRQLEQIAERGQPIATLHASEAVIYERFGYGIATTSATVELVRARARLRPGVATGGPVRMVPARTSWDLLARIYATAASQVGAMERFSYWWRGQSVFGSSGPGPLYAAVHGKPGAEDGFVRYRPVTKGSWLGNQDRMIEVTDFVAGTPAAHAGLVRFLLSIDLVDRVLLHTMPADHSIEKLVFDERSVRTTAVGDELWLRLIDVEAALGARSYRRVGGDGDSVAIGVHDERLPANTGVYVVSAGGVQRSTTTSPDLSLDVAALATVYLGGTRWWQLAAGGRVHEHTPGALATAEALFAADRLPFCGTLF